MSALPDLSSREGPERVPSVSSPPSVREFAKHWFTYGIGSVLGRVAGFVMLPVYTRYLSPEEYGIRAIVVVGVNASFAFLALGIPLGILRFYRGDDQRERPEVVSTALVGVCTLAGVGTATGWLIADQLAALMFGHGGFGIYLRLGLLSLFFSYILEVPLAYLQVTKRSVAFATVAVLRLAIGLTLNTLFVVVLHEGVFGIFYAEIIGNAVFCLALIALTLAKVGTRFSAGGLVAMIRYGAPSLLITICWLVINNADRLTLTRYGSLAEVGHYSLAEQLSAVLALVVIQPFATAWGPAQFELGARPNTAQLFARVFNLFASVLVVGGLALALLAEDCLRLVAREAFWPAASVVPVLVTAYILLGVHTPLNSGILISKRTAYWGFIVIVAAVVNVTLNLVLVPRYRAMGAAVARLGGMAAMVALTYLVSQRLRPIDFRVGTALRTFACAVALFLLSRAIPAGSPLSMPLKALLVIGLIAVTPPLRALIAGRRAPIYQAFRRH